MNLSLLVGLGAAAGGLGRFWISTLLNPAGQVGFPTATCLVNLVGSLAIGLVVGSIGEDPKLVWLRILLVSGFLGGFTTFSALSLETLGLIRAGEVGTAVTYVLTSVVGGLLLCWVGFWLAGLMRPQLAG
ncbi:MAG: fluoride efflux transporter CrcB [Fimbriimonadaceae bacterium]|nr:fluoride efflux transporter CrcB [Fimbriimonadaceae bacterium]